jgi:hypothetical protein
MRRGHLVVALLGAMLFSWVIVRVGLPVILQQIRAMRVALPIVVALSLCRLLLQTAAWSAALNGEGLSVPLRRLIGIRLASQSVGYLTVLGPVLSEPMKVKLLRTPTGPTITATFVDDGVYWFTSALLGIAGGVSAAFAAVHGAYQTWAVAAVILFALGLFIVARRKPFLPGVVRILGRRAPSWLSQGAAIERSIRNYCAEQPALVGRMFWIDTACQLLMAGEVVVVLWSLARPIHVATVLAIEGLTRGLRMASGWVPARLGADEGGAMSAFMVAGLPPTLGLTLALTRRTRDLLWSLIGLAWLLWMAESATNHEESPHSVSLAAAKEGCICGLL